MTLGPVMLDIQGIEISSEESELLSHPQVGGLILFSRNYTSKKQLLELIQNIRKIKSEILIAVDQEGGRVQRLQDEFVCLPPAGTLGTLYGHDPQLALENAQVFGWLMAAEVLAHGIDFSFAPVLDVDYGISQVIGDRGFASDPDIVFQLTRRFINGMHEAGMAATGKHFPGHGSVIADSHLTLPMDDREYAMIHKQDIYPFEKLLASTPCLLDAIMPAHVIYSKIDTKPAGFSKKWLQEVLRNQYKFTGIIFSDDLSMEAASCGGSYQQRTQLALEAGCDMVLVCNNPAAATDVIHYLDSINYQHSSNLQSMSARIQWSPEKLYASKTWQQAVEVIEKLHIYS